ncbi:MAG TPA: DUF1569 domain-containing protein [Pedobacter sp.]|jgi:hypothetical protein
MVKYIFENSVAQEVVSRINKLDTQSKPQWGKMNVAQMLAHCNVTYEMVYEPEKHKKPNAFLKFILKTFVKKVVTNEVAYKQNNKTAPQFIITDLRDFEKEKSRLVEYINRTQQLGESHFEGKESHSFGVLNRNEWNNMFYKHLDHHLKQFGA